MTEQPPSDNIATQKPDEFYVGYLPTPASHLKTLRVLIPGVVLAFLAGVAIISFVQRDPGSAVWRSQVETFEGIVRTEPWPMLITTTPDGPRVVLLVEEGKHGAQQRVAPWIGQHVAAKGLVLTRDSRIILELVPDDDAIAAAAVLQPAIVGIAAPDNLASALRVSLRGEIIDSKCYHGAMKPGEGKTHKACATLCISNGIPAMFIAEDGSAYLLATADGAPLDKDTLSKIGERVEVRGEVTPLADMRVLRIEPRSVKRL